MGFWNYSQYANPKDRRNFNHCHCPCTYCSKRRLFKTRKLLDKATQSTIADDPYFDDDPECILDYDFDTLEWAEEVNLDNRIDWLIYKGDS